MVSTYANSMMPDDYINIYFKGKADDGSIMFGKFISNIRIDTHHDNLVMQKVLNKHGFMKCGVIYLKNGNPRLAYHYEKGKNNE